MSAIKVQPAPTPVKGEPQDPDMLHAVCPGCFPDFEAPAIALCGIRVTQPPEADPNPHDKCVVCADLLERHLVSCPRFRA